MHVYRLTFVNPATSPRPSYETVDAESPADAVRVFWSRINPANVVGKQIYAIERGVLGMDARYHWHAEI